MPVGAPHGRDPSVVALRKAVAGMARSYDTIPGACFAGMARACGRGAASGGRRRHGRRQMVAAILKIGRYMAITMPPTMTPMMTMIIGSSRLLRASTALLTSSS